MNRAKVTSFNYFLAFITAVILLGFAYKAKADDPHTHGVTVPNWYDPACCSNNDCKPVEDKDIDFSLDHLGLPIAIYKPTGNAFSLKNADGTRSYQHRDSQDERYHVCINPRTEASLCFYNRTGL